MSLLVRRVHLYLALFLSPWMVMYAVSTIVMNHRGREGRPAPRYEAERTLTYPGEMAEGATARQMAAQLLATLDLEGAFVVVGPYVEGRVVIERQDPVWPRRITYTAADRRVVIEKMVISGSARLERLHRRRGYRHDSVLENLWAASVDLTIAGLIGLALSGLWMWWGVRAARGWGAVALGAGLALFGLFLAVL